MINVMNKFMNTNCTVTVRQYHIDIFSDVCMCVYNMEPFYFCKKLYFYMLYNVELCAILYINTENLYMNGSLLLLIIGKHLPLKLIQKTCFLLK